MKTPVPFVLFDDAQMQAGAQNEAQNGARLYVNPVRVIACSQAKNVSETLADIDQALKDGFHVAGYLAYELGYLLEDKLTPLLPPTQDQPLIWMGVFKEPQILCGSEISNLMTDWAQKSHSASAPKAQISRADYLKSVATIQDHIRAGDVYQINYTFKQDFDFTGCPKSFYARLRTRQKAAFGAFIQTEQQHILSLSPELFVKTKHKMAHTRPMKGTAPRAANPKSDQEMRNWLAGDEKSKAENLMIVDLLRNDLSRISKVGTVKVTDLFTVETYPTLHQMTSGIESQLTDNTTFSSLIKALFPCGSVTGAPKVKAMELIRSLESSPRGVYTGAIGYASIKDGVRFNVAIRTLTLDAHNNGEMGIGSGIVYDSNPQDEWDECHLKARFVTDPDPSDFQLLETLKWSAATGFTLLDGHLDRLKSAAAYFCYPFDQALIEATLNEAVTGQEPLRVRLTLACGGQISVTAQPLNALTKMTFTVSDQAPDANSPFTFHKTTRRDFYDHARTAQAGDEVLFTNAKGEITEGSFTNIFVEINGKLYTPPLSCGLLAGTLRQDLVHQGHVFEAVLTAKDLSAPNKVFLGNSVRGLVHAHPLNRSPVTNDTSRVTDDTAKRTSCR